jgi:hypothetical protein
MPNLLMIRWNRVTEKMECEEGYYYGSWGPPPVWTRSGLGLVWSASDYPPLNVSTIAIFPYLAIGAKLRIGIYIT